MSAAPAACRDDAPFLGVERSFTGRRWTARLVDEAEATAIGRRCAVSDRVARIMAGRGISAESAPGFLDPTLRETLPDPDCLTDMPRAVARLQAAIAQHERIAVFGDYDVDGATASALLVRFFRALGVPLRVYIPDRVQEGYGPNPAAMERLAAEGCSVVVTVDCGTTAHAALTRAAEVGLDVIVLDHHIAEPGLPPACAVINPNRIDADGRYGQLAAVGVAFLLVVALNRHLRASGHYRDGGEPDLMAWLDLVALGTVCDVVPLTGVNRALVAQGLKVLGRRGNVGLAALADAAGLRERPGAYHLGFVLGPRINAGGRVGSAALGSALLSTEDAGEAQSIAAQLHALNAQRQATEQAVLDAALDQVAAAEDAMGAVVFAAGAGWHPGVIGIVAARLVERYDRPALVVALDNGVGKGSGRSVGGADLGAAVVAARQAGLLVSGGGHAMAAGFTVAADRCEALRAFLDERIAPQLAGRVPELRVDGALQVAGADAALATEIERLAPFGMGNPQPRFGVAAARVAKVDRVGKDHFRAFLSGSGGGRLKAMAFRAAGTTLGQRLAQAQGTTLHLVGQLRLDRWQGREEAVLVVDDAARAT